MISVPAVLLFAVALAIACATPGPSTIALVARVLARGRQGNASFCIGLVAGDVLWLLCAVVGVAAIAEQMQAVFLAIKYAGVVYLLYLAWKLWTAPLPTAVSPTKGNDRGSLLLAGLLLSLGNPKTMLFYIALLPGIISLDGVKPGTLAVLILTVMTVVGTVLTAYVFMAARARRLVRSPCAMRRVNRGSGALMASAAGIIAWR